MNARIFLFLDYDGTLAPIQSTPDKAVLAPEVKRLLQELSDDPLLQVAIVTGRSLQDITALVGLRNLVYAGNHGFEISGPGISCRAMEGKGFENIIDRVAGRLRKALSSVKGVLIENKEMTLSLHYRLVARSGVRTAEKAFRDIVGPFARANEIRVVHGKKVLEVKPAVDWDKGKAVQWLLEKYHAARRSSVTVYIGDDTTDETAFNALAERGITVFVGRPRLTAARYRLKGPGQVYAFLRGIREVLNGRR
jgi:alpha,alpha-trehalase